MATSHKVYIIQCDTKDFPRLERAMDRALKRHIGMKDYDGKSQIYYLVECGAEKYFEDKVRTVCAVLEISTYTFFEASYELLFRLLFDMIKHRDDSKCNTCCHYPKEGLFYECLCKCHPEN